MAWPIWGYGILPYVQYGIKALKGNLDESGHMGNSHMVCMVRYGMVSKYPVEFF